MRRHRRVVALIGIALLCAACGGGGRSVPLRFTKAWATGRVDLAPPRNTGQPVTIALRLGDAAAFAKEFQLAPPRSFPCQQVSLLFRSSPSSPPQVLWTRWADSSTIWSSEPQVCLHAGLETQWHVLIVRERGDLPLDVDGQLVLVTGGSSNTTPEIAVRISRVPKSPAEIARAAGGEVNAFVAAESQWVSLRP
jgi:hypothetical protein